MSFAPNADITVVMAAKDEGRTIATVVDQCLQYAGCVLVMDGFSEDDTADCARKAGAQVVVGRDKGKGDALRKAIPAIATPITVFIDADGSHDPSDIPRLVAPILADHADHVSGSRLLGGSSELHGGFDEFMRLAGSSFITACINWRFAVRLSESQNGFRAIRTSLLRDLQLAEPHTTIEQEMVIKTLRRGRRMAEVPAHEHARRYGASHIQVWRVAPRYLSSLVRYLFF